MANTQIAFGRPYSENGATLMRYRVAENIANAASSTAGSNTAKRGETAEITSDVAVWATVNGTAAAGTTLFIPAGTTKYFPGLADGDTVSVVNA